MDYMPNLQAIQFVVDALRHLLKFPNLIITNSGICYNVCLIHFDTRSDYAAVRTAMNYLFRKWPKFSGNIGYPIPVPKDNSAFSAENVYYDSAYRYMWDKYNSYGALRYELVHFMIETGEQLLKENKEVDFKV